MKIKLSSVYRRHIRIIPGIRSYVLATSFVLLLGIIITVLSWSVDRHRIDSQKTMQLNDQAAALEADITSRLSIYEQVLRGASGLLSANDQVNRDQWRRFIQQYDINTVYPGSNGIGYIQYVPATSLDSYTASIRAEGFPDFSVKPAGARPDYAPVTYIEPFLGTSSKALGFDVLSDSTRRKAADEARDSGKISISEKLELVGDNNKNQAGFVMYTAIYNRDSKPTTTAERQANLRGFVFAGYRSSNFFDQAIQKSDFTAYSAVQIFDGSNTNKNSLIYQSKDFNSHDQNKLSKTFTTKVSNRDWTFQFAGPAKTNSVDQQRSNMILIGGITISFAIAGFLFLVMFTRARAIVYSKQFETQQAKDDLLSLASHQLRTPATAVKQYLGMILEGYTGEVDPKQLPAVQKAYTSNERQLETINQILYVAKADAGRLSINRSDFDINLLIDDIVLDLEDSFEENDQTIIFERSRKRLKVFADEASIRMVVENLISNAGKYSFSDGTIRVKTGIKNNETYVSVIDQGVGIAPEDFNKLFKKFSRIDNDLSLQVGGSGIGLYIDKVLIELHKGRIEVESELGNGSSFTIYLPKDTANNLTDGEKNDESI